MDKDNDLPEKVIPIRTLRILRGQRKHCECYEWHTFPKKQPHFLIDHNNREIICEHCGNVVDAYEALTILSKRWDDVNRNVEQLLEQAKEIQAYKPWLKIVKQFERSIQRGKMVPCCPHCSKGILLEELTYFVNKERELSRRQFERAESED